MFRVFIEESVIDYIEGLTFITQADCYFHLKRLFWCGLTATLSGDVKFKTANGFEIRVDVEKCGNVPIHGVILKGTYKNEVNDDGGADYYIDNAVGLFNGHVVYNLSSDAEIKKKKYREIDDNFFEEKDKIAEIADAEKQLPLPSDFFNAYRAQLNRTHQDLKSIRNFKRHSDKYNSSLCTSCKFAKCAEYIELSEGSLKAAINRVKRKYDHPYILVNFVDKYDELDHAKMEFFFLVSYRINRLCEGLDIVIIDVPVSNKKEFLEHYSQAPAQWGDDPRPFSMLIFRSKMKKKGGKFNRYKTLYFDFFDGCRGNECDTWTFNQRFSKNRALILHEMFAAAFCAAHTAYLHYRDLRAHSEKRKDKVIAILAKDVLVVELYDPGEVANPFFEWLPIRWGYPFIICVYTGRNKDKVRFHKQLPSGTVGKGEASVKDRSEVTYQAETCYEMGVLSDLPGNQTMEGFYSVYTLDIIDAVRTYLEGSEHVPSVVGR